MCGLDDFFDVFCQFLLCFDKTIFDKQDKLELYLDDGNLPSKRTKYTLNYYTGEIKGSNGVGIVRELFGMKKFFVGQGEAKLMAEVLVDVGIGGKMRYDSSLASYRICDEKSKIWRFPKTECEVETLVAGVVEKELKPLQELESFRGVQFDWVVDSFQKTDEV